MARCHDDNEQGGRWEEGGTRKRAGCTATRVGKGQRRAASRTWQHGGLVLVASQRMKSNR